MEYNERKRWLFLGLPWTFTKYHICDDMITVDEGLLKTTENDCYMYKVQDVTLTRSLCEKFFNTGTITCFTGDTTHSTLVLKHIRHSREIKDYILNQSEVARLKRRTINTVDISAGELVDGCEELHAPHIHG